MKRFIFPAVILAVCISMCSLSCTQKAHPHGMPPGQAKKITGSQSAKPFAPGQKKKP